MSSAHYTDNPTDFTEHTLDGNQVTVDSWTHKTANSRLMIPFGYLSEHATRQGYEPKAQLDDMNSHNSASIQGDSEMSSTGSSCDRIRRKHDSSK